MREKQKTAHSSAQFLEFGSLGRAGEWDDITDVGHAVTLYAVEGDT